MLATAAFLLLISAPDPEFDVVWCKDGRKISGIILSETDKQIVLRTLFKGRKGETVGAASVKIPKREIARIERMPDEARRRAARQSEDFGTRRLRLDQALKEIITLPARIIDQDGLRATGKHFEVISTCDDAFVREVTFYLDELFTAYRRDFSIEHDSGRRIRVYLLSDVEEYTRFQAKKFGGAMKNPAFYYPPGNFIVAYNLDPKEEAAKARKTIIAIERKIKGYIEDVRARETKIRKEAIEIRGKINAEADRARRKIRADAYGNKNARLREVEEWRRKQLGIVKGQEAKIRKGFKKYRDEANAVIAKNRTIIEANYRLRLDRNRKMFEYLFHEGFHAFARNFLWRDGKAVVPRWFDEGLASYYEMSAVEVGELIHGGVHPGFLAHLRKTGGKTLPIEEILRGNAGQFLVMHRNDEDRSNLYYAQSWAIAHYMVGRVPRERIMAYVKAVVAGADRVKAFETMMGHSIRRVAADIDMHLASLK